MSSAARSAFASLIASLQESALIPDAVSSSNAVGFWQFKDFTAQEMGLRVDSEVDERMHIASASRGAARYLKQCNHYFNNWLYALQSYQMGAGGVMRLVGERDLGTRHIEITPETYWYVRKFIAHKVAFEDAVQGKASMEVTTIQVQGGTTLAEISKQTSADEQQLRDFNKWLKADRIPDDREYVVIIPKGAVSANFGVLAVTAKADTNIGKPVDLQELEINGLPVIRVLKGEGLQAIARRGNIGLSAFLHYNEIEIDRPLKEGELYFLHKKKKHAAEELYTVKHSEDVWTISQRFGIQQKFILRFNDLSENSSLTPGVTLFLANRRPAGLEVEDNAVVAALDEDQSFNWDPILEGSGPKGGPPVHPTSLDNKHVISAEISTPMLMDVKSPPSPTTELHEVKSSDTLYSVSRQYGVTIKELMDWNEKKNFSLVVGEKLKVHSN